MAQFHSVLTNYGVTAFAKAISTKQPLNILKMAVGDGNGRAVTPNASRTALVREVYRANISSIKLDVRNNKQVIFELTIPEDVGGFYIREMGIFDHNEKLVAIANTPESYKPQLTEGSGKVQVLRMILLVSSSDSVSLTVDNSLIWAKRSELTPKDLDENSQSIIEENGHSHRLPIATLLKKGITKLFSGLDSDAEDMAATPKAIKALKSLIDAITRNLGNYIPNSKKSNAVDSNSADTVATSYAVKLLNDGKLSNNGGTATGNYFFRDGNIIQTGEERKIQSNSRVVVERDNPTQPPYFTLINANINEAVPRSWGDWRELGGVYSSIKSGENYQIKTVLKTYLKADGSAVLEAGSNDSQNNYRIGWRLFGDTNNFVVGNHSDDGENRLQVNGTAKVISPSLDADNTQVPTTRWVRLLLNILTLPISRVTGLSAALNGLSERKLSNSGGTATGNYFFRDGDIIQTGEERKIQSNSRVVVERDNPTNPPYFTLINANINEAMAGSWGDWRELGGIYSSIKNGGKYQIKTVLKTYLKADGSAVLEAGGNNGQNDYRIGWRLFSDTNNFIIGDHKDDGENRLQVNGTAKVLSPPLEASNHQVPTTAWVRALINSLKREDFTYTYYAEHYAGASVYNIKPLGLKITMMRTQSLGARELYLPEPYTGHPMVLATDRGHGEHAVNGNYFIGDNRIRVGGRHDTSLYILVMGRM